MAGFVLGAAGAAIGAPFGFAGLGFSIGYALGGMFDRPDVPGQQAQPLMDLKVPGTEYGQPIPYIRGRWRTAGQMWWNSDRIPIKHESGGGGGSGKGGAPEPPTQTTITYDIDMLVGLHDEQIIGISHIFSNKKLIWRSDAGASSGTLSASASAEHWDRLTIYTGADDQMPDPDYEAWVDANEGVGLAPAYRQRGTVFIKGLHLGQSGQIPLLEFIVVVDGESGPQLTYTTGLTSTVEQDSSLVGPDGTIWCDDPVPDPARIGVYDSNTEEWTYIDLEAPWVTFGSGSNGPTMIVVPEWDVVYVNAIDPDSGDANCLGYSISERALRFDFASRLEGEQYSIIGADPAHGTILVYSAGGIGLAIWGADGEGYPQVASTVFASAPSPGGNTKAWPDSTGVYWLIYAGAAEIWRLSSEGRTVIAAGADGITDNGEQQAFDSTRQCLFFFSNLSPAAEHLKKIDCETSTISRVTAVAYSTSQPTPALGSLAYASDRDQLVCVKTDAVFLLDPDDGSIDETFEIPLEDFDAGYVSYSPGVVFSPAPSGFAELRLNVLTPDCPTVPQVQSGICVRSGLTVGQINVTPLSSISREVCAFLWSQVSPGRVPTELLMTGYFYESVMSGSKIKFVPRGGSTVATIPYADLASNRGDGEAPEPLPLRKSNDVELPAWTDVTYANLSANHQNDTQPSDRLISATGVTRQAIEMALGMEPSEAKSVADTISLDQAASVMETTFTVLRCDYPTLEPTDPVLVTTEDGSTIRMRVVAISESFPLMTCRAVMDDTSVLSSQGITSTDYTSQTTVASPVSTITRFLDIPILRDSDDDAGFYATAKGASTPYPGSSLYNSPDNSTYTLRATFTDLPIFGTCTTALGNWTGPRIIDEMNKVRVSVGTGTILSSSTRDAVLQSRGVNLFLIGDEIIQAITVTLVSDGVYDLTRLLRGCFGTDWASVGHVAGERCVLLRELGLRRVGMETSDIGASLYYKAVTFGRTIGTATAQQFTNTAVGLKPYSPVDGRVSRDSSNNATITWRRRTRLSVRLVGASGMSVPLGEESEAYEVDIFGLDSNFTTALRTISTSTASASYTAAEQTADGLTPGDPFYYAVYQLSAEVGRGYPLEHEG